jgi:hypothetical protein
MPEDAEIAINVSPFALHRRILSHARSTGCEDSDGRLLCFFPVPCGSHLEPVNDESENMQARAVVLIFAKPGRL